MTCYSDFWTVEKMSNLASHWESNKLLARTFFDICLLGPNHPWDVEALYHESWKGEEKEGN